MAQANDRAWPAGISTITLFVENLATTKAYYEAVFGLPVIFEDPQSAVFRFGSMLVNLLVASAADELIGPARVAGPESGSRFQFTIDVPDVDATCAELARRGVTLLNGPLNRPWGVRTAAFVDPGGHIWEIAAPIPS